MSRARSVPAFIVENSAPWMNGTASAKARNESVGNPGSSVEAWRPPELSSISATGKSSGGIALAGWRAVRMIDRCARAPTCVGRALIRLRAPSSPVAAPSSVRPVLARNTSSSVGARSSTSAATMPLASIARITSAMPEAVVEAHGEVALAAELLAEPAEQLLDLRPVFLLARDHVDAGHGRSRPSARPACPRRRSCRGR